VICLFIRFTSVFVLGYVQDVFSFFHPSFSFSFSLVPLFTFYCNPIQCILNSAALWILSFDSTGRVGLIQQQQRHLTQARNNRYKRQGRRPGHLGDERHGFHKRPSNGVVIVMELSLLWVLWGVAHVSIVVWWSLLFLARGQHALQSDTNGNDAQDGRPFSS